MIENVRSIAIFALILQLKRASRGAYSGGVRAQQDIADRHCRICAPRTAGRKSLAIMEMLQGLAGPPQ
jgi:hypothetical protein